MRIQVRGLASAVAVHLEGRDEDAEGLLGAILEELDIDEMEGDFGEPPTEE